MAAHFSRGGFRAKRIIFGGIALKARPSFIVWLIIATAADMKGMARVLIIPFPSRYLKSIYRQRRSIARLLAPDGGDYVLGLNLAHADTVEIAIIAQPARCTGTAPREIFVSRIPGSSGVLASPVDHDGAALDSSRKVHQTCSKAEEKSRRRQDDGRLSDRCLTP